MLSFFSRNNGNDIFVLVPACQTREGARKIIFMNRKMNFMGIVHAEIELISGEDLILARQHIIGQEEIKKTRIRMLVDSGAYQMAINENIQAYLNLPVLDRERVLLADGSVAECDVVGPIEVRFANRRASCDAHVLPGDSEPLLGAIPMEQMDVVIEMKRQELVVNPLHPEGAMHRI